MEKKTDQCLNAVNIVLEDNSICSIVLRLYTGILNTAHV